MKRINQKKTKLKKKRNKKRPGDTRPHADRGIWLLESLPLCKDRRVVANRIALSIEPVGWLRICNPIAVVICTSVQDINICKNIKVLSGEPGKGDRIDSIPASPLTKVVLIQFFDTFDNPKSSRSPITGHGQWLPILLGHSQKSFFVYNYVNRIIYTFFYKKVKRLFNSILVAINNKKFKNINNLSKTINKC